MNYTINKYHRNEPDRLLLADLRKTAKRLGKRHVSYNEYEREGKYHPCTLRSRFGSWNNALIKAGLRIKSPWRIPDEELFNNLKKIWDSLGRQPRWTEMLSKLSDFSPSVYSRHFGSWNKALEAFGKYANSKRSENPLQKNQAVNIYRHGRRNKTSLKIKKHINKGLRFDVFKRDKFKCRLCGASPATDRNVTLHADHIIPYSKGGETIISNLQTLCSDCNLGKRDKIS